MTDLEMTRLAAKALGKEFMASCSGDRVFVRGFLSFGPLGEVWEPITNSAQAFELLDTLYMRVIEADSYKIVLLKFSDTTVIVSGAADLKRAIVECAARYQLEKEKQA